MLHVMFRYLLFVLRCSDVLCAITNFKPSLVNEVHYSRSNACRVHAQSLSIKKPRLLAMMDSI